MGGGGGGGGSEKQLFLHCVSLMATKVVDKSKPSNRMFQTRERLHCLASRLRSAFVLCASLCDAGIDHEVTYCSSLQDVSYRNRVKKPGISHITYQFCRQDLPYKLFFEYLS